MPTITPFLWFDTQAEDAMNFYASVFPNAKVLSVNKVQGKVLTVEFELEGQKFIGLNAGPKFPFTEAISFVVNCQTQAEVDDYWTKLSAGGSTGQCGWLKDKFGLSWQIVPAALPKLLGASDPKKRDAVFQALMKMTKIDSTALQAAHDAA